VKKAIWIVSLVAAAVAVMSCATPSPNKKPDTKKPVPKFDVIEHKASSIGGDIPEWVTVYVSDGNAGVEALAKYKDKFVFVGEDSGTNLNALRMWAQGFNVAQDLARLVSTRVQAKFAGAIAGSPDAEVGRYFENVVKNVADATITGARKETDFWVFKRYYKADGRTLDREVYDYYVLTTIDKEMLKKQLDAVISGAKTDKPLTKEQTTAVDRVKEAFYEGF
jgi:hypothetical protein